MKSIGGLALRAGQASNIQTSKRRPGQCVSAGARRSEVDLNRKAWISFRFIWTAYRVAPLIARPGNCRQSSNLWKPGFAFERLMALQAVKGLSALQVVKGLSKFF